MAQFLFFVSANGWDVSPCYDTVSKEIIPAIRNGMCWLVDREIIDKWIVKG